MEYIIGVVLALLALFGFGKYKEKKPTELDNKKKEIEDNIDKVDDQIKDVEENGVEDIHPDEVVDYWKDK